MTKSKSGGLSRLPKEQVCSFVLGPVSSWFMPNAVDLWTQPRLCDEHDEEEEEAAVACNAPSGGSGPLDGPANNSDSAAQYTSYFAYGSIGCFCLGEIHHRPPSADSRAQSCSPNEVGGLVNKLVDVKDDNSRVACVRFQRGLQVPLILALSESGSLLIYDQLLDRALVHFKKAEVLKRFAGLASPPEGHDDTTASSCGPGHHIKRPRFNVTQQINSCTWPSANDVFLGVSLLKEKKCLLIRLKLNNIVQWRDSFARDPSKCDLVNSHQVIELELDNFASPICLVESAMLDAKVCLVAVAMDDGFITVISLNLEDGRILRTIKLGRRHNDQVCSMSLAVNNRRKHPLGLLASVSRDGLVLIWDIENEFYFADYLAIQGADRATGAKINWFALRFIAPFGILKQTHLAVSTANSGLALLEIPENARSKVRLKDLTIGRDANERKSANKRANEQQQQHQQQQQQQSQQVGPKHNALIFNIEYDPLTRVLMTSSLDGNQILWKASQRPMVADGQPSASAAGALELRPHFLVPAMPNNARTHMLRHSPIREDLICMALGKAGARFHSIGERLIDSKFDMTPSCALVARRLVKANVSPTSVAWHPNHEYRLAIGTLEGQVYRVDITPRRATLVEADHCKQVVTAAKVKIDAKIDTQIDDLLGVDYQPMELHRQQQQQQRQQQQRQKDTNGCAKAAGKQDQQQRPKTDGVYSLCWGPNPANSADVTKHAIYAIGSISHTLFIYHSKQKDNNERLSNYLDEFLDTSLPEASGLASEVAWKSSMDLMALGTTDGRILIVSYLDECHQERSNHKLFRRLMTIEGPLGSAFVQCLAWHPTTDKADANYYKLAASSNESPAFVFNLRETLLAADVNQQLGLTPHVQNNGSSGDAGGGGGKLAPATDAVLSCYANKLKAHEKAITDIAWNPHEPSQLATCSFDRTCFVWSLDGSLMEARVIAKFCARDRLFTLDWSLVDENLIYTSGHDSVVWAWRPSENRHSMVSV